MAKQPETKSVSPGNLAVRDYTLTGLVALLLIGLVQAGEGLEEGWELLPVLLGVGALVLRWSMGPVVVLLGLLIVQLVRGWMWFMPFGARFPSSLVTDLFLAGALIVYVASAFRLNSLTRTIFPADPRRRHPPERLAPGRLFPMAEQQKRAQGLVSSLEVGVLFLTAAVCVVLAFVLWTHISVERPFPRLRFPVVISQALLVVWLVGVVLAILAAAFVYLRWNQATPEEGMLFMQDQLWRETRSEQRRAERWLVWTRQRWQARKGE
jgi:hypothetical protein